MYYNSKAHEQNGHIKHSLLHGYAQDGAYLGETKSMNLVNGNDIEVNHAGSYVTYNSETGRTTVYGSNYEITAVYENVYAQQIVILGQRKIA